MPRPNEEMLRENTKNAIFTMKNKLEDKITDDAVETDEFVSEMIKFLIPHAKTKKQEFIELFGE